MAIEVFGNKRRLSLRYLTNTTNLLTYHHNLQFVSLVDIFYCLLLFDKSILCIRLIQHHRKAWVDWTNLCRSNSQGSFIQLLSVRYLSVFGILVDISKDEWIFPKTYQFLVCKREAMLNSLCTFEIANMHVLIIWSSFWSWRTGILYNCTYPWSVSLQSIFEYLRDCLLVFFESLHSVQGQ